MTMGAAGMRAGLVLASSVLFGGPITAHASSAAQQEFASVTRLKANVAHGEQLFDTCAACHGSKGAGTSDGTVPVTGQHYQYLLLQAQTGTSAGRSNFSRHHVQLLEHIGSADIDAICDYVSRLGP